MRKSNGSFLMSLFFFLAFAGWTVLVKVYDVKPIGPQGSSVGFASLNQKVFDLIGTSDFWLKVSDYMGYMALGVCGCFALVGLVQFIKGKKLAAVDRKIVFLGIFYVIVLALYVAFDKIAINMRPVLEADGSLEPSYPSSHTMLALCVFITMFMQEFFNKKGSIGEKAGNVICGTVLVLFMIFVRLFSGVHWISDIIGSVLISIALVTLYKGAIQRAEGE